MAVRKRKVKEALASWLALNRALRSLSEEEVLHAMDAENARPDGPRDSFIRRLDQRRRGIKIDELRKELGGDA